MGKSDRQGSLEIVTLCPHPGDAPLASPERSLSLPQRVRRRESRSFSEYSHVITRLSCYSTRVPPADQHGNRTGRDRSSSAAGRGEGPGPGTGVNRGTDPVASRPSSLLRALGQPPRARVAWMNRPFSPAGRRASDSRRCHRRPPVRYDRDQQPRGTSSFLKTHVPSPCFALLRGSSGPRVAVPRRAGARFGPPSGFGRESGRGCGHPRQAFPRRGRQAIDAAFRSGAPGSLAMRFVAGAAHESIILRSSRLASHAAPLVPVPSKNCPSGGSRGSLQLSLPSVRTMNSQ